MTERLDEHKMKYAVDTDKEAEDICRWAAARAGVIVVAPVVGTMTLMANEVYMITRLAKLRGIKLSESAVLGLLGSLGGAFVGQTLATLIPFAPVQIPVGMSVTYAVGKVANAWLEAGCPEDLSAFKTTYEEARIEGIKMLGELKNMACKDKPLGDESRRFEVDDDSPANKKVDDLLRKVKGVLKKDIEGIKMLGELKNMACKDKPLGDESRRFEVDDDSPANKKVDDLLRKVKGVLKKD